MNKDLVALIKIYGTKTHSDTEKFLQSKSQDKLVSMLIDLTTHYYNDKNSSTLREYLIVSLEGFEPTSDKIGYNGYQTTGISRDRIPCEAKPKNVMVVDGKTKSKLDGGGNFTDYTWGKLERHKKENPMMIIGGFINGKLVHTFLFKYNHTCFVKRLEYQLEQKYPDGHEVGKYLRSASFRFLHYKDSADLKTHVYVDRICLANFKPFITGVVYEKLLQHVK